MSKDYNKFCRYCTGNNTKEVNSCDDKYCPFYEFRFGGLEPEIEQDIIEKLLVETHLVESKNG